MKRILCVILAFVLLLTAFAGCGKKDDAEVLEVIDTFITAIQKGDTNKYIECYDPDIQTIIKSGTNSIGNAFGIDNAYGLGSAFSSLFGSALTENMGITIEQKEIKSSSVEEDKASYYIIYTVTVDYEEIEEPISTDVTLEFKMIKKDKKWYIQSVNEISEEVDTEILATGMNITYGMSFSDGVAFIQYRDKDENTVAVAIDTAGKILFKVDDSITTDVTRLRGYENGIMIVDEKIYDKTGKVIASPEISGYDELLATYNGYTLVRKKEESYLGDKYYMGVLNNKGEWEYQLSTDHPIIRAYNGEEWSLSDLYGFKECIAEYIVDVTPVSHFSDHLYYNIKTNEVSKDYVRYESRSYQGEDSGIYKYDTNGNRKLIIRDIISHHEAFFDSAFIGIPLTWDENGGYIEGGCNLYDYNGNIIIDLSKYNIDTYMGDGTIPNTAPQYVKGYLLAEINNGSGTTYTVLFNEKGEPAFEPIKMSSGDEYYPLDEVGFVYVDVDENNYNSRKYMLYDYSGKVTVYEDISRFEGFNDGLALVQNAAGQWYYINYNGDIVIK